MVAHATAGLTGEPGARQRLLEGAKRVFSSRGYEAATTRMIAEEAGVNLASIPYYFGTKEALYATVIHDLCHWFNEQMTERMAPLMALLRDGHPGGERLVEGLGSLVEAHIDLVTSPDMVLINPLVAREYASPSAAFGPLFEQVIRPQLDLAAGILGRLLDMDPGSREIQVKAFALLGMGVHVAYASQSFRLYVGVEPGDPDSRGDTRRWIRDLVCQAVRL